jgi:hypothetical protein
MVATELRWRAAVRKIRRPPRQLQIIKNKWQRADEVQARPIKHYKRRTPIKWIE